MGWDGMGRGSVKTERWESLKMGLSGKREGNSELEERWNVARSKPESKPVAPKALRCPSFDTSGTRSNEKNTKHRNVEPTPKVHCNNVDGEKLFEGKTLGRAVCCARNGAWATRSNSKCPTLTCRLSSAPLPSRAVCPMRCHEPNARREKKAPKLQPRIHTEHGPDARRRQDQPKWSGDFWATQHGIAQYHTPPALLGAVHAPRPPFSALREWTTVFP